LHSLQKSKTIVYYIIRIIVLIVSVYILLRIVDIKVVIVNIKNIPIYILIILTIIALIRAWLTGGRWSLLNPDLTGQLSKWHYFRYTMVGHTFNLIMPGALGGDFARTAITVSTVKKNKAENVIAIIVDRFIGLISILLLGLLSLMIARDIPVHSSFYAFYIVFLSMILIIIITTNQAVIFFLENTFSGSGRLSSMIVSVLQAWKRALHYFKAHKRRVLYAFLLCLPIHIVAFISKYLLARSLEIDISFFSISLITAIVWLITAIPITISGAGVRELSMVYLLSLYGISAEQATALSVYTYIISLIIGLIGVVFILDWGKYLSLLKKRLS
jgi:glycosyltransferase 2 family protein